MSFSRFFTSSTDAQVSLRRNSGGQAKAERSVQLKMLTFDSNVLVFARSSCCTVEPVRKPMLRTFVENFVENFVEFAQFSTKFPTRVRKSEFWDKLY